MTDTTTKKTNIPSWLPAIAVVVGLLITGLIFHERIIDWFGGGVSDGAAEVGEFQSAGPFQIAVGIEPQQPVVGENRITIVLRDAEGKPVTGADVDAVAVMPAMGAMPEMREAAKIEDKGRGRYTGEFDLSMSGAWPLTVTIRSEAGDARLTFDMSTRSRGLRPTGGGQAISAPDLKPEGVAYHTCSMHPSVKSKVPGECPICSMDLEPVTHEELRSGTILIDAQRRQLIGVRTAEITEQDLVMNLRAVGVVKYDQTRLADVSLKYHGWIGEQFADYIGKHVEKGEPLLTIYSPGLWSAQQEYLDGVASGRNERLLEAARTKLLLWDITEDQIKALEQQGKPQKYIPVLSPVTGTVIERNAVPGSAVEAGMRIYHIADLSTVWIEAELYENEVPLVQVGQEVDITLSYLPERQFEGKVSYIYPYLDEKTRRGRIRIEAENPDGLLKPDMYADVRLRVELGERLAVPEDAILYGGESRVVFLDLGEGRLRPQRIKTGRRAGDFVEVLEGLKPGDIVVTSGNFLIASESKLKTGIEKW